MRMPAFARVNFSWRRLEMVGSRLFCLLVMVALLVWRAVDPVPLQMFRARVFDYFQILQPRPAPEDRPVMIVDLDDASLAAYGQWPWPRSLLARLVDRLTEAGVAAIGFDIVFAEPDRLSPGVFARDQAMLDEATRRSLMSLPSNDHILAEAIRRGRVVLGSARTETPPPPGGRRPPPTVVELGGNPRPLLQSYPGILRNVEEIDLAAAGWGVFSVMPEHDGIIRRVPAVVTDGKEIYPNLALELLRLATGNENLAIKNSRDGIVGVILRPHLVSTDEHGQIWLYAGRHDPGLYIPAKDVLDGKADPARLEGRLVLIGTSAAGLKDIRATAVERDIPGVELHAQVIETILGDLQLSNPVQAEAVEEVAALIGGLAIIIMLPWIGARWTFLLLLADVAALGGYSWEQFTRHRLLYDPIFPIATTVVIFVLMTYASYAREEVRKRQVRGAFSRYLAAEMIDRLVENPELLRLGGEKRDMTILFCDVRGFTSLSESYDAVHLTHIINKFLTPMSEAILAQRGTIDKYIGDCVMAFWNAPLDDADHASHACRAALDMLRRLGPLNDSLAAEAAEQGLPHKALRIGIGINSGPVVVGNMGSELRFDYSVLGDNVNLASRLEGQSKTYGVSIVVGEQTQSRLSGFACLELDLVRVKGKETAVRIFTLLGDEILGGDGGFKQLAAAHDAMLAAYRRRDWERARGQIAVCRPLAEPFDLGLLYNLYDWRIAAFSLAPPPADWDGVYEAESK